MQNTQLSFFSVNNPLVGNYGLSLTCRPARQTAQRLWATCSSAWMSLSWKPFPYIMFEPPRNILWPLYLFLPLCISKKSLALSPLADAGGLPSDFPKASLSRTEKKKKNHVLVSPHRASALAMVPHWWHWGQLTCRILHGHTLKVLARELKIHIKPKMKNCLQTALWNICFLWLSHILPRLSGNIWELVLWVGGNNATKEEKLTYLTAKYFQAEKSRFSRAYMYFWKKFRLL